MDITNATDASFPVPDTALAIPIKAPAKPKKTAVAKSVPKPAAKKKPVVKKAKPAPAKKAAKKAKPTKKPAPAKKVTKKAPAVVRSERMDLRLSKAEKAMLQAKAKKLRRTLTSLFVEFAEKLK